MLVREWELWMLRNEAVLSYGTFTKWDAMSLSGCGEEGLPTPFTSSTDPLLEALVSRIRTKCSRTELEVC